MNQNPNPIPRMPDPPKQKRTTLSPRPVHRGLEARRGEILRSDEAGVQLQSVAGKVLVAGTGRATFDVNFPVTFVEQPAISFGAAVDDNQGHGANNAADSLVTASIVLVSWVKEARLPGIFSYRGAKVACTMADSPGYVWVHWQATGKAYRNPAKDLGSTGGTI